MEEAEMAICGQQDLALPLAPGLLSFLASASDNIRTALHQPQIVRRRSINPKKYFLKQLSGNRPVRRPPFRLSPVPTRPSTGVQRLTIGRAVEQKSLDALFDPRTVSAATERSSPASLRRRKLPASFFTEPRPSSCPSPANPAHSPGSAASNDSIYEDSQGSGPDATSLVTSHLDLDALLGSPLWTDEEDSFSAKTSPGSVAGGDHLYEYSGLETDTQLPLLSSTQFDNRPQICHRTNSILDVTCDVNFVGEQTHQSQSRNEQCFPSCQYAKRNDIIQVNNQIDDVVRPMSQLDTSSHYQDVFAITDSNYNRRHLRNDAVTSHLQGDIGLVARQPSQIDNIYPRWQPASTPEVISNVVMSACSNYSEASTDLYQASNVANGAVFTTVSSIGAQCTVQQNLMKQVQANIYSSSNNQIEDSRWSSGEFQGSINPWQRHQWSLTELNDFVRATPTSLPCNSLASFHGGPVNNGQD